MARFTNSVNSNRGVHFGGQRNYRRRTPANTLRAWWLYSRAGSDDLWCQRQTIPALGDRPGAHPLGGSRCTLLPRNRSPPRCPRLARLALLPGPALHARRGQFYALTHTRPALAATTVRRVRARARPKKAADCLERKSHAAAKTASIISAGG